MALSSIQFSTVKEEDLLFDFEDDHDDDDFKPLVLNGDHRKCGEIFITDLSTFLIVCADCEEVFDSIFEFGGHCQTKHERTDDLDDPVEVKSKIVDNATHSFESPQPEDVDEEESFELPVENSEFVSFEETFVDCYDADITNEPENVGKPLKESSGKRFCCTVCTKSYTRRWGLKRHNCKSQQSQEMEREQQMMPTEAKRPPTVKDSGLFCEICKKYFPHRPIFRRHALEHEPPPKALLDDADYMRCLYCRKEFQVQKDWREHEEEHRRSDSFICLVCPKIFKRSYELQMHMNIHTGRKPYQCDQCPIAFAHKVNLTAHIRRIHMRLWKFTCEICSRPFHTRTELVFHQRLHTGEKPHQCEMCGMRFRVYGKLREHRKRHSTTRDFQCDLCSAAFYSQSRLKEHAIIHTDERPFVCNTCGSTFNRRNCLRQHMKLHLAEKKYVCCCGKAFAQYAGLHSHKRHCREVT